jgi:hypothetical protein
MFLAGVPAPLLIFTGTTGSCGRQTTKRAPITRCELCRSLRHREVYCAALNIQSPTKINE